MEELGTDTGLEKEGEVGIIQTAERGGRGGRGTLHQLEKPTEKQRL